MEKSPADINEHLLKINNTDPPSRKKKQPIVNLKKQYAMQTFIFILTFFTYAILHTSREAWAFLKDDIEKDSYPGIGLSGDELGTIDMVFLAFYSIGLYISGVLGDNMNKKILIGIGYILVCGASVMIGFGGIWKITTVWYYLLFFAISGIVQSVGWPSVVAIMANWFGKSGRGIVLGIWTANPNVGNIIGSVMCNIFNAQIGLNWMWTWMIISFIVGGVGIINLIFLVEHPSKVGLAIQENDEGDVETVAERTEQEISQIDHDEDPDNEDENNEVQDRSKADTTRSRAHSTRSVVDDGHEGEQSINFFKAWLIPGVIQLSVCYLGLKLANYGIMLWLPKYAHDKLEFNENQKTVITVLYDVGTITGSVLLGLLSDKLYGKRSPVCFIGLLLATVGHILLIFLTKDQKIALFILIFFLGFFVGGISNLISGTACADLGKQDALKNNSKALSTVTGIVDGTGSIGAAAGQKGIGALQDKSWTGAFILMTCFVFLSSLPLSRICCKEVSEIREIKRLKKEVEKKRRSTYKSDVTN